MNNLHVNLIVIYNKVDVYKRQGGGGGGGSGGGSGGSGSSSSSKFEKQMFAINALIF